MVEVERLPAQRDLDRRPLRQHETWGCGDGGVRGLGLVPRSGGSGRVACGKRLRDRLVVRVPVVGAEALEGIKERLLPLAQGNPVLGTARARDRRLDRREIELDDLRVRRGLVGLVPERVLLAVRLDESDPLRGPSRQSQVAERLGVDREEAAGRAVLRRHVPDRRPVGEGQPLEPVPEVLDELPDDAHLAQDLGHGEDEVRRGRSLGQRTRELEADDLRDEHRDRLAEHRSLRLDATDAPAENPEPVDHGRVRVGPDERVGERPALALVHDAREELEVDLVDDPGARRHDLEVVERPLAPAQEGIALAIPLQLELRVARDREAAGELVHLQRVVDDELHGKLRIDPGGLSAEVGHRIPHRRQIDDRGHAGEVLEQHACRHERDLARGLGARDPACDGLDVVTRDGCPVLVPEDVLEEHAERVGKAEDVVAGLESLEPEDLDAPSADAQLPARAE